MTMTESIPQLLNVLIRENTRAGYYLELFLSSNESDNLDLITCPICREAYFEPILTECGHNFCHSCIQAMIDCNPPFGYKVNRATAKGKCPIDRQPISVIFRRNLELEKNMLCMKVKCPLYTHGCEWTGSLLMLETHLISDCLNVKVKSENSDFVERGSLKKDCV
ncbi:hypothetical protein LOD99_14018 [Oopsacas minuta]|uniref:RING-type domain-containing protein n=1 Tax=Oopsacas minuta TaxID=111878 RepID=A0AAV7KGL6_9METZ|nr:hypothetical protein LOD99_14018 [Oopsacas minuta]